MRATLIAVSGAALAVVGFTIWGWPASKYLHGDYIQYWLASRALLDGWDPYDPVVWRAMHETVVGSDFFIVPGAGFSYPLTTAVAALPFATVGVAQSAPLWFVAQTGSAIAGLVMLQRRSAHGRPGRKVALLLGLGALIQPVFLLAGEGNIARFLVGILSFGLALLVSGSALAGGVVLGALIVKPQLFIVFGPAVLLFVAPSSRLRVVGGVVATVATLLLISVVLRPNWIQAWVAQSIHVQGLYGRVNLWGDLGAGWVAWVIATATVMALLAWWLVRRPPFLTAAAAALALSLYVAPYANDYDAAVLLVCLGAYLAAIDGLPGRTRALLVVLFVATSSAVSWPVWLGFVPNGWQSELPAPAACLLLVLADTVARRGRSVGPSAGSRSDPRPVGLTAPSP
ncbi:MAG TPA: glycosyltransferase family 87 protein [Candidatus Saccharimonadales bacterium]|nr:glycosyltransferase family 87 protein [Candidatus Saccharimonadales bacterium]